LAGQERCLASTQIVDLPGGTRLPSCHSVPRTLPSFASIHLFSWPETSPSESPDAAFWETWACHETSAPDEHPRRMWRGLQAAGSRLVSTRVAGRPQEPRRVSAQQAKNLRHIRTAMTVAGPNWPFRTARLQQTRPDSGRSEANRADLKCWQSTEYSGIRAAHEHDLRQILSRMQPSVRDKTAS
jgi:hypothetical protein